MRGLDKRDVALQSTIPTEVVPRFSPIDIPSTPGDRILVASNGMFVEVRRNWGYFVRRIAAGSSIPVPYGDMAEATKLHTPRLPRNLLLEFVNHAKENCDIEVAASLIWNETSNGFRLVLAEAIYATGDSLRFHVPALSAGDHLIVDCHSHAHIPAFFSTEDDRDDCNSTKFSFVVGNCNAPLQSVSMRLCLKGIFEPFNPGIDLSSL